MAAVACLTVGEASGHAGTEAGAIAARDDAFDSPGPNFHGLRFVLSELVRQLFGIVTFGVNFQSIDLNNVFDDDLHFLGKRFGRGKKSYIGHK